MSRGLLFRERVDLFEKKSGEKFFWPPGYQLEVLPDNTFLSFTIEGDTFWIGQVVGRAEVWRDFVFSQVKKYGCKFVRTYTFRNPKVFCRKWGAKVENALVARDGRLYYQLMVEVD